VNVLVDDQCLSLLLRGETLPEVQDDSIFTTGYWYYRLCQAYFRAASLGALSRPFQDLPESERLRAEDQILALPESIGLISMRDLAPKMGQLINLHPHLNLLAREALAAALWLEAVVVLNSPFPTLQRALSDEGRRCVVLGGIDGQ
jgi:hypothetical protein